MIAVWFSCGAASAVAAKLTVDIFKPLGHEVRVVNNPIAEEDADNLRFKRDVEKWIGHPIETAINMRYPDASCESVWQKRKFMAGREGAPCTVELKKQARYDWESKHRPRWHVLGFTHDETKRFERFVMTERENVIPVLIQAGLTKQDCMDILSKHVRPPRVYEQGFPNANCVGCVKATSPTYWNLVRQTHPEVFAKRAATSRQIGAKLVRVNDRRIFLDELDPNVKGRSIKSMNIECGIFCEERGKK